MPLECYTMALSCRRLICLINCEPEPKETETMTQVFHAPLKPYQVSLLTDKSYQFCPVGYRLAVIRWKETTDKVTGVKKPARSAICCPVPVISFQVEPEILRDAISDCIAEKQDM